MFKFTLIFLYLSICSSTDLFSMAKAPAPQQAFSIFKSLEVNSKKNTIYREVIPIITTRGEKVLLDFKSFILENKITGEKYFQIQLFYRANTNTNNIDTNTNNTTSISKGSFHPLSIAFNNNKSLPIVQASHTLSNLMGEKVLLETSSLPCVGTVYLFPDDITNLLVSLTKDPLAILQQSSPSFDSPQILTTQQLSNQFIPMELSTPSKELNITLKNYKEEEIVLSFSSYYATILKAALDFYIKSL